MAVERTLCIIKPDAVEKKRAGAILHMLEDAGFTIVACKKHVALEAGRRGLLRRPQGASVLRRARRVHDALARLRRRARARGRGRASTARSWAPPIRRRPTPAPSARRTAPASARTPSTARTRSTTRRSRSRTSSRRARSRPSPADGMTDATRRSDRASSKPPSRTARSSKDAAHVAAVERTIAQLDRGELRVASPPPRPTRRRVDHARVDQAGDPPLLRDPRDGDDRGRPVRVPRQDPAEEGPRRGRRARRAAGRRSLRRVLRAAASS